MRDTDRYDLDPPVEADAPATGRIGIVAGRIAAFGESITEAHDLGLAPGLHDEPWTLDYQREIAPVYFNALPAWYLANLATGFADTAISMTHTAVPPAIAVQWATVSTFLNSVATAIKEKLPADRPGAPVGVVIGEIRPATPGVMPFGELASHTSRTGATALTRAGRAVVRHATTPVVRQNPLTADEQRWLTHLACGHTIAATAAHYSMSRRTLHRRLTTIWKRLGATGPVDGLASALTHHWIQPQ